MDLFNSFLNNFKLDSTRKQKLSKNYQVLYFRRGQLYDIINVQMYFNFI